jgi:hypothetical protein
MPAGPAPSAMLSRCSRTGERDLHNKAGGRWQDVAVTLHKGTTRQVCVWMGSHTGRDPARRWTVVATTGNDPRSALALARKPGRSEAT